MSVGRSYEKWVPNTEKECWREQQYLLASNMSISSKEIIA
jgi:hypothetical protein